jgi:hypothetical protein
VRALLKGQKYPPYQPHFRHVRTGRLGSSWAVVEAGKSHYQIVNQATNRGFNYPVVVIGERQRSYNRAYGWYRYDKIIESQLPKLRKDIEGELDRWAR